MTTVPVPDLSDVAESSRRLGMTVTSVTRQARWRPCRFVEAERDGVAMQVAALRNEMIFGAAIAAPYRAPTS